MFSLSTPIFGLLRSLGYRKYGSYYYFEQGALFWSLTRLFCFYYRIISVLNLEISQRQFLEADIESFIIRMRIILNDIAFIIRQLFPDQERGLKPPTGKTHPKNREMSMGELLKYFDKHPDEHPHITKVIEKNEKWICRLKELRNNIIHYKSQIIIFETEPDISFVAINPAGTQKTIKTKDGRRRIVTTSVFEYINSQTLSLHNFLQKDLFQAISKHSGRQIMGGQKPRSDSRMTGLGIEFL